MPSSIEIDRKSLDYNSIITPIQKEKNKNDKWLVLKEILINLILYTIFVTFFI
jgi:hypothetical protein